MTVADPSLTRILGLQLIRVKCQGLSSYREEWGGSQRVMIEFSIPSAYLEMPGDRLFKVIYDTGHGAATNSFDLDTLNEDENSYVVICCLIYYQMVFGSSKGL